VVVDAAHAGNLSSVRKLIKEKADVNAISNDGSTALLWAAYHGDADMAKALIAAGASVDVPNRYGVTPLLMASRNGDVDVMKVLLEAGAQATRWHPEGETPLMAAARTGSVDAIKVLLSHGAFINASDPYQEETPLMWAASEGHLDAVKALLAAGADPNLQARVSSLTERKNADHASGGFTALMFAARNGHTEVVKALMKGGADPKITNADGVTATIVAIVNDRLDLAKDMVDLGADPNDGSLFFAVEMHDATTDMRAEDATRFQPDHPNKLTALGLVKALLDVGADVNKPFIGSLHSTTMCCLPQINSSPFYRAAVAADVDVLKLLVAKGAQIEWSPAEYKPKDGKKAPPGMNAAVGQSPLLAALKGGKGPPISGGPGYTRNGPPPFREPGSRDPNEAMQILLAAGANPNTKGTDGSSPLHQAVQAKQVPMIKSLVAAGAKLDAVNKDNKTPLMIAEALPPDPPKSDTTSTGAPSVYARASDSRDEVIKTLRDLMHLGPNDPTPQPPPAPAKDGAKESATKEAPKTEAK